MSLDDLAQSIKNFQSRDFCSSWVYCVAKLTPSSDRLRLRSLAAASMASVAVVSGDQSSVCDLTTEGRIYFSSKLRHPSGGDSARLTLQQASGCA